MRRRYVLLLLLSIAIAIVPPARAPTPTGTYIVYISVPYVSGTIFRLFAQNEVYGVIVAAPIGQPFLISARADILHVHGYAFLNWTVAGNLTVAAPYSLATSIMPLDASGGTAIMYLVPLSKPLLGCTCP